MPPEPKQTVLDRHTSVLITKVELLSRSRFGLCTLAFISFLESSLPLPILTDPFLATAVLFNRAKVLQIVLITTISSALGGLLAYGMAYFAFDYVGPKAFRRYFQKCHRKIA